MAGVEIIDSYHAHNGAIASITFTSIPQSYKHLWFIGKISSDGAYHTADVTKFQLKFKSSSTDAGGDGDNWGLESRWASDDNRNAVSSSSGWKKFAGMWDHHSAHLVSRQSGAPTDGCAFECFIPNYSKNSNGKPSKGVLWKQSGLVMNGGGQDNHSTARNIVRQGVYEIEGPDTASVSTAITEVQFVATSGYMGWETSIVMYGMT